MKKLNITKEQFNRSNYFQRKYGKLEYVSESGRLFKTNKGKVLKFVNEGGLRGWELEQDLDSLKEQCEYGNMSFGEVERTLLGLGFKLDEGGSQSGRADDDTQWMVYEHPEGYCVRLTYRFEGRRGSKRASTVMDFDWNTDDKIKMKYNESKKFGRMFKESTDGLKNLIDEIFDDGLYEDGKKAQILLSKLEAKLNDLGLLEDENVKDYFDEFTQTIKICLKSSRIQNFYRDKAYRIADGLKYSIDSALGYTESTKKFGKKFKESFGMGFGDRFCDCESDPIEYNGQTYDTWTMYSGDDEIGDVMFADDALRQDMEENGIDPEIMEMVDLWVNPRDSVDDAIDQIISG